MNIKLHIAMAAALLSGTMALSAPASAQLLGGGGIGLGGHGMAGPISGNGGFGGAGNFGTSGMSGMTHGGGALNAAAPNLSHVPAATGAIENRTNNAVISGEAMGQSAINNAPSASASGNLGGGTNALGVTGNGTVGGSVDSSAASSTVASATSRATGAANNVANRAEAAGNNALGKAANAGSNANVGVNGGVSAGANANQ